MSLLFERIISDNPHHYMTAMEQHRLEKRRMHRHSCVIAILCERIYSETAQIGKAENAQTLMCHRNPLDRIYFGSKPSKRSYRKQQDTRKWTIRVGRADMVQAQEEHAKTIAHAEQVSHNIDSELSKSNARKQQDMHK